MTQPNTPGDAPAFDAYPRHATDDRGELVYDPRCWMCLDRIPGDPGGHGPLEDDDATSR